MAKYFKAEAGGWDTKDRVEMAMNIWKCMSKNMAFKKTMRAADIGAGTGLLSIELAKKVANVTAIDNTKEMLDVLTGKIKENNISNINIKLADVEKNGLSLTGLDAVISSMALHHIKNVHGLLNKINTALSPGGIFGIADLDKENGGFHNNPARADVKHFGFDRDSLEKDLKKAGFKNLRFTTAYKAKREAGKYPIFLVVGEK